jgi:hypothetical protein
MSDKEGREVTSIKRKDSKKALPTASPKRQARLNHSTSNANTKRDEKAKRKKSKENKGSLVGLRVEEKIGEEPKKSPSIPILSDLTKEYDIL